MFRRILEYSESFYLQTEIHFRGELGEIYLAKHVSTHRNV
jgi:hypothetical protein